MLVLLVSLPASAQCRLAGSVTTMVRIRPPGAEPFLLELVDHDVVAVLRAGARTRLQGRGPLRFAASAGASWVPVALRRSVVVGPLTLRPGTPILTAEAQGAGMRATLSLADGVTVSLDLPCRVLRLGATQEPPDIVSGGVERGALLSARRRLSVHSVRGGVGSVRVRIEGDPIRFAELARRDDWVRIRRDFSDGTTLDGWVRTHDVQVVEEAEIRGVLFGTAGYGCGGGGHGASHSYTGPATLRRGSSVFDHRAGTRWAEARVDTEVRVDFVYGAEWVQVEELPGFRHDGPCSSPLRRAWARRSDVHVPRLDDAPP